MRCALAFLLLLSGCTTLRPSDVYRVRFETSQGDFVVEVHRDWAPIEESSVDGVAVLPDDEIALAVIGHHPLHRLAIRKKRPHLEDDVGLDGSESQDELRERL